MGHTGLRVQTSALPVFGMPLSGHVCSTRCLGLLCWGLLGVASAADGLLKGISYGVSPDEGRMESDDMFNDPSKAQWGCPGRGDLALMAQMGANAVRLYGNDPRWSHAAFLDEAASLGLGVMPGISDWPYMHGPYICANDDEALPAGALPGNCHDAIRGSYLENLRNGFAVDGGAYHRGMKTMIAVNEPDLKLGSSPKAWARAVVSAIDGMLSAEEDAGMNAPVLPITATVSFSICTACEEFNDVPGLGQMWTLRDAMQNPGKYGYVPKHDLSAFYDSRFVNSFNTGNPAVEIEEMFLDVYSNSTDAFQGKPVFIAEYHCPSEPVTKDLPTILEVAGRSEELLGVSFFEWVNRHDEGGHTDWGIFDLTGPKVAEMDYNGTLYNISGLTPVKDKGEGSAAIAHSIAKAYGGTYSQGAMCRRLVAEPGWAGILLP